MPKSQNALTVNHEINVTPFIDVMLVLLIVFMVAAPLATVDVKVDLPVSSAKAAPQTEKPVFLTIKADGQILLNETLTTESTFGASLRSVTQSDPETRLLIHGDKSITYDRLIQVMNRLRGEGYFHVALVGIEGTENLTEIAAGQ